MKLFVSVIISAAMMLAGCSKDIEAPSLSTPENDVIVEGVALEPDVLFGIWEGKTYHIGTTQANSFEQTYRLEFQSVDDAEVLYSHWYANALTNDRDSVCDMAYNYSFDGTGAEMIPETKTGSTMKAVYIGDNEMELYTIEGTTIHKVCTLSRTSDPEPVITGVDRTLPQAGEKVTVSGRNLQFVDHLYLPTPTGEVEVTDLVKTSKQIQFVVPQGTCAPGAIRCQATGAHLSTYSPAYMFCDNCVFFKTFSTAGGVKPYWTGTEFENTIGISDSFFSNVSVISSNQIPSGHSLYGVSVINPDYFISFFGNTPKAWPVDTGLDPNTGHMRLSFGDCIQHVLDHCDGMLTEDTKCSDVAIQMDVYVYSDGEPVWKTGFISFRLDKGQQKSLTQGWFGQTAMWDSSNPVSFADGWKTFTLPLSAFAVTENSLYDTLGKLGTYLRNNKSTHAIIKFLNYQLDANHPAQDLSSFQINIANMRLVSIKRIGNKKE